MLIHFFASSAFAVSPVGACAANAEASHPGLSVDVSVGGALILTGSSDLDAVFDLVAQHHADPSLVLTWNVAARRALRMAMDCIFDGNHLTLSSVWLNQERDELNVRPFTMILDDPAMGISDVHARFVRLDDPSTCSAPHSVLRFESASRSVGLLVTARGSHDFELDFAGTLNAGEPKCTGACDFGSCLGVCDPETGTSSCECDSGEGCEGDPIVGLSGSDAAVVIAN